MGMKILKLKYHIAASIRIFFLKLLFGKRFSIGSGSTFRRFLNIFENGAQISIGKDCFFNHGCSINALKRVSIGDGCIFGENVKIYDHNHRFSDDDTKIKEQGFTTATVNIGNHCWFGSNSVVLKGVQIGNNCVIGAGVVVSDDIPDDSIVTSGRKLSITKINR